LPYTGGARGTGLKAIDKKLQDFVGLLHRPLPPTRPRQRPRRVAISVTAGLIVAGVGTLLWFPWPGLSSLFNVPARQALALVSPLTGSSSVMITPVEVPAVAEPISVAHAEPWRPPPPAPPQPAAQSEPAALPPQEATRVLVAQPPLPPVPSLASPEQPVTMMTTAAAAVETQQVAATIPAWIRNAVPAPARDARPRISVVIDDVGLDRQRTARAIALPAPLTLSFLPYAMDLPRQTEAAHKAGHELLVHVPMEPLRKNLDAGPSPLDIGIGSDEVLQRLRWDLARFDGYVGINNHMGSRFTSDAGALEPVMQELRQRGLLFVDSRTVAHSAGTNVAGKYGVPHAGRDVFLDDEISTPAIAARLAELERVARHNGSAIAIGHPHDQTLDALKGWLRDVPSKGFVLVPVSAIVKERAGEGQAPSPPM
jgi:uncharacterized protein